MLVKSAIWWNLTKAKLGEIWFQKLVQSASWWNLQQWGRWTWAKIWPSPQVSVSSELSGETGYNLQVGEICKLVKSDKSETGWNLNVGEIYKLVKTATVGTMDLGKNPAEPRGECGLRIVRSSGWNLKVGEIYKLKSASGWNGNRSGSKQNLQLGEICKWVEQEK